MRMRPHTERVPKPMLPVLGRPFIEHQIELLRASGVRRFLLLVGYLGEQIEAHLGDGARYGVTIEYSYEPTPLGTGGALKNAADKLEDDFLLINGDTLLELDYKALLSRFRESGRMVTIAATRNAPGQDRKSTRLNSSHANISYAVFC